MGLTIHYDLASNTRSAAKARGLVEQLRVRALELPLKRVGEIIELSGDEADFDKVGKDHPHKWLLVQSTHYDHIGENNYSAPPKRLIAFSTWPGDGCEQANFGLCLYPASIEIKRDDVKRQIKTKASGWCWSSFCKTQFASDPSSGGVENFLRCHLAVIALLDHAKSLGMLEKGYDESDYFEKRDIKALVKTVGQWNEMVAGFAGYVKDRIGDKLQSPIFNFPDFEHLEARGRKRHEGRGE